MKSLEEFVILVDEDNVELGTMEKLEAHRSGSLHRAFSVFIVDSRGRVLLQKRAAGKYHSGGLWSNSCCGHPRPDEEIRVAARRRLQEEMGVDCELTIVDRFHYFANLEHGLVEHELDFVLIGVSDEAPVPDPSEVAAWKWAEAREVSAWLEARPEGFTAWFAPAFELFFEEVSLS